MGEYINALTREIEKTEKELTLTAAELGVRCVWEFDSLPFRCEFETEYDAQIDFVELGDNELEEVRKSPVVVFRVCFAVQAITFEMVDAFRVPEAALNKIKTKFKKLAQLKLEEHFADFEERR